MSSILRGIAGCDARQQHMIVNWERDSF